MRKNQFLASVSNRPYKLAYIVNRNINLQMLEKLVEYNTALWGGKFNYFVPTDGKSIREDWFSILYRYSPDRIVWVGDISDTLKDKLLNDIYPFTVSTFDTNWVDHYTEQRRDILHGISMRRIYNFHYQQKGSITTEESNCRYPAIDENIKFLTCATENILKSINIYLKIFCPQVLLI